MVYILPQALIFQNLRRTPAVVVNNLGTCVLGPLFDLKMYAEDKNDIRLGEYEQGVSTTFQWPNKPAGAVPDEQWTKLFMDSAWLNYWTLGAGDAFKFKIPGTLRSEIRSGVVPSTLNPTGTGIILQDGNGFAADARFGGRAPRIGDGIKLDYVSADTGLASEFTTMVSGFAPDIIPASLGTVFAEPNNPGVQTASVTYTPNAGNDETMTIAQGTGSAYNPLAAGMISDTFSLTVTSADAANKAGTLSVVSASGKDNQVMVPVNLTSAAVVDIGRFGLKLNLSGTIAVGDQYTVVAKAAFTPAVATSPTGLTYTGPYDATFIVEVVTGGRIASGNVTVEMKTDTGVDAGGPYKVTAGTAIQLGSYGPRIQFAAGDLAQGSRFYIEAVARKNGPIRTFRLARTIPEDALGQDMLVSLFEIADIVVDRNRLGFAPLTNFSTTSQGITLADTMTVLHPGIVSPNGEQRPVEIYRGTAYVQYRSLRLDRANRIGYWEDTESARLDLGPQVPENPFSYGVYLALSNSEGRPVYGVPLIEDSFDGYSQALGAASSTRNVWGMVPLTQDKAIQDLVKAHVLTYSAPENGRWRVAWLNSRSDDIEGLIVTIDNNNPFLATIGMENPDDATARRVYSDTANFITNGVRPGDLFRFNYRGDGFGNWTYSEYQIDEVINEDTVILSTGAQQPITVASKFEVWRGMTNDDTSTRYAALSGNFATRRVRHIWPDRLLNSSGVEVPGYFLCAALAGLRSSAMPQQGLTNAEITGFTDVSRTLMMSVNQLNRMAEAGTWIVTQSLDGRVYTRHQLTTGDYNDQNQREDSLVANDDSMCYQMQSGLERYIGRANVTDTFIAQLTANIGAITDTFRQVTVPEIGPQAMSVVIDDIRQHVINRDRIVANITIARPSPFNNLEAHLNLVL